MKGIKAAQCFHSALHSAPMLFFSWPLLPCAREEFDKVTPGPCYLFLSLHLLFLSQILIVCLAGLGCLSSHQWGHTFGLPSRFLPSHLPCHLFCCWNGQRTGRSDSISYILRLMHRTEPLLCAIAHPGMRRGQGFTAGTSDPHVLLLPALHSSPAFTSLNLNLQGGLSCTIHF